MRICVFCSASYTIDPKFNKAAREFVREASAAGYTIVSGGTVKGTMGEIADELRKCGGKHIGIIPRFMYPLVAEGMSELVWTETMAERKALMREGSDAAVALPGGIGTLDELIETLVLRKLGRYDGRIYVLNIDGFYDPLEALIDHYVTENMMDHETRSMIFFPRTIEQLMVSLNAGR